MAQTTVETYRRRIRDILDNDETATQDEPPDDPFFSLREAVYATRGRSRIKHLVALRDLIAESMTMEHGSERCLRLLLLLGHLWLTTTDVERRSPERIGFESILLALSTCDERSIADSAIHALSQLDLPHDASYWKELARHEQRWAVVAVETLTRRREPEIEDLLEIATTVLNQEDPRLGKLFLRAMRHLAFKVKKHP